MYFDFNNTRQPRPFKNVEGIATGYWFGNYYLAKRGNYYSISAKLRFREGIITGSGRCSSGVFTVTGNYISNSNYVELRLWMVNGRHPIIYYKGTYQAAKRQMSGTVTNEKGPPSNWLMQLTNPSL